MNIQLEETHRIVCGLRWGLSILLAPPYIPNPEAPCVVTFYVINGSCGSKFSDLP